MIDYRDLSEGASQLKPIEHHRKIAEFRIHALGLFVNSLGMLGRKSTANDVKEILKTNFLNLIAWQQQRQVKNFFQLYDSAPWFDKFQHLYFLYRALTKVRCLSRGPEVDVLHDYSRYTHR